MNFCKKNRRQEVAYAKLLRSSTKLTALGSVRQQLIYSDMLLPTTKPTTLCIDKEDGEVLGQNKILTLE